MNSIKVGGWAVYQHAGPQIGIVREYRANDTMVVQNIVDCLPYLIDAAGAYDAWGLTVAETQYHNENVKENRKRLDDAWKILALSSITDITQSGRPPEQDMDEPPDEESPLSVHKQHVMGLDRETIDWKAHRAFLHER